MIAFYIISAIAVFNLGSCIYITIEMDKNRFYYRSDDDSCLAIVSFILFLFFTSFAIYAWLFAQVK